MKKSDNKKNTFPEIEGKSILEIKNYQEKRMKETLKYVNEKSPFYKKLFAENNINIDKINTIEDLRQIPVTTKTNLQKCNDDFLCVDKSRIIHYLTTSGTLGNPVVYPMTANDMKRLAYNESISFACADGTPDDIYQLIVTLDRRFMAGLAYYEGIKVLGAGVVCVGPGSLGLQFDTIERIKPNVLVTVPSFLMKMISYAQEHGIDYNNSSIKSAVCIGENLRDTNFKLNTLGGKIKEKWDIKLYSTYASTEMAASFTECKYGIGGHHHPELLIAEFLDENNNIVDDNEPGELTITSLGVEGLPLVRFKTGDICYHYTEPCKCGRNTMRISPLIGRNKQMIKYKGTSVYAPAFYDLLDGIEGVENYIVIVSTNSIGTDDVLIRIGSNTRNEEFKKIIKDCFRTKLRVAPSVEFDTPTTIEKLQFSDMTRKKITFIDNR